jgi:pimeloyl-ACP methyl ester carboxylesterase
MATFVLVHGAFRGGWAWDQLAPLLTSAGHTVIAPTLTGCEPHSGRVGTAIGLGEWIADVVSAIDSQDESVVLVAHSQAGLVCRCVLEVRAEKVSAVVYLDAAVPRNGERGVDLNPPGSPAPPENLDPAMSIPARPVGTEQGFLDQSLADFVNTRLVPTPLGPSLEPVVLENPAANDVPARYVFFSDTPPTFPCQLTRIRLDGSGLPYEVMVGPHDSALTNATNVAELLLQSV